MDTNTAQPRTTREAEAMGLRYTDWEVAYEVWSPKGELLSKRKSFKSWASFDRWMNVQADKDNQHRFVAFRYPGND